MRRRRSSKARAPRPALGREGELVLRALLGLDQPRNGVGLAELAAIVDLPTDELRRIVDRLAVAGVVERSMSPDGRRGVLISAAPYAAGFVD